MIGLVRAAALCATLAFGLVSAEAADKAFKRDDLADAAIKLEAQIKSESGPVGKSAATLRTDAKVGTVDDWLWTKPKRRFAEWCERFDAPRLLERAQKLAKARS